MSESKNDTVLRAIKISFKILVMIVLIFLSFPEPSIFDIDGYGAFVPRTVVYHSISEQTPDEFNYLYVQPSNFERQLNLLHELGYVTLFADEWQITQKPSVIITFDDGYSDNYTTVFPLLQKYKIKATVFLITDLIGSPAYLNKEQIIEMYESGLVSFQSHSRLHDDLSDLTKEELTDDLHLSALWIEDLLGYEVKAFSYPHGLYNDFVISAVREVYTYAYTTEPPEYNGKFTSFNIPRAYVVGDYDMSEFCKLIT